MNPVNKALWFIEAHFQQDISLDDIAAAGGVSRYYISCAFRDQFGLTPESVRAQRHLANIQLVEPIKMDETLLARLEPPRFEDAAKLLVAGLTERYDCNSSSGIPAQWQRFLPHLGRIPGQVGAVAYGGYNSDDVGNLDYMCAVQVTDFSKLSAEWGRVRIPARCYAVFAHRDHVSTIRSTWHTIWTKWLPESGHRLADAPDFERYGEDFDSRRGTGSIEIWVPLSC
jgi:AraC family transcriptional regulator